MRLDEEGFPLVTSETLVTIRSHFSSDVLLESTQIDHTCALIDAVAANAQ